MTKDVTDLILTEYQRFSESFWRNEDVGEKRVNYYLGLITAVFAGLITLVTSDFAKDHQVLSLTIAAAVETGLLAVGYVTYLRMRKRNAVTDEYKDILDGLRQEYFQRCATPEYTLQFRVTDRSFMSGGLSTMVFALNAVVASALVVTLIGIARSTSLTASVAGA